MYEKIETGQFYEVISLDMTRERTDLEIPIKGAGIVVNRDDSPGGTYIKFNSKENRPMLLASLALIYIPFDRIYITHPAVLNGKIIITILKSTNAFIHPNTNWHMWTDMAESTFNFFQAQNAIAHPNRMKVVDLPMDITQTFTLALDEQAEDLFTYIPLLGGIQILLPTPTAEYRIRFAVQPSVQDMQAGNTYAYTDWIESTYINTAMTKVDINAYFANVEVITPATGEILKILYYGYVPWLRRAAKSV